MDLIFYRGLNCHLAGIINIANSLNVNYLDGFASLWSETDFSDEVKYNIYMSKRVFSNLKAIGVITETLDCYEIRKEGIITQIPDGGMLLIGMDTFYIPWHPMYKHFHDPHYFFAQKETAHSILCFDPVYNEKNIKIEPIDIFTSVFEITFVHKIDTDPPEKDAIQEAREVLRCHPETSKNLLTEIQKCKNEGKNNILLLIKQINAMINNRYLFRHFLHNPELSSGCYKSFFNEPYFLKWEAVRNGLYKASIAKDNKSVIDEVCDRFTNLMHEETTMAKEIITMGLSTNKFFCPVQ